MGHVTRKVADIQDRQGVDAPRMTSSRAKVLRPFIERPSEAHYGFALMRETGMKAGSLYPALDCFRNAKWLDSFEEDIDERLAGRPRRRLYRLNAEAAPVATAALAAFYEDLGIPAALIPGFGVG